MSQRCPEPDLLLDFAEGALAASARGRLEAHLSDCASCRGDLAAALRVETPAASIARPRWAAWAASLAAGVALVLGAGLLWRGFAPGSVSPPAGEPFPGASSARRIAGAGELLTRPETVELPDGTRLRIAGGARARFGAAASGERHRLVLERGEVEVAVPKESGGFRVAFDAGEVRVLGTRFTARAFRFTFPDGTVAAGVVEVEEGAVSLANGQGEQTVKAGHRGVLIDGRAPIGPIQRGDPPDETLREAVRKLARSAEPSRDWSDLLSVLNLHRRAGALLRDLAFQENDPKARDLALRCAAALTTEGE